MRRETLWFSVIETLTVVATGTPVLLGTLNAAALAQRPFTFVRSRGFVYVDTDQEAADEHQSAAVGQAVVSDQATAIGVTAVPTPVTDSNSDLWYVYEWAVSDFKFGDGTGFGRVGNGVQIDSKAMRKVEEGQDAITAVELGATSSGATVTLVIRNLIKLH